MNDFQPHSRVVNVGSGTHFPPNICSAAGGGAAQATGPIDTAASHAAPRRRKSLTRKCRLIVGYDKFA